jgi:HD-like signal output (HDOD) protein
MKVPSQALGKTATCVKCGEKMKISVETADPADNGAAPRTEASAADTSTPEAATDQVVELLLQHGLITKEHLRKALTVQADTARPLWRLLIEMGSVSEQDFHSLMVKQKGTASIDLSHYNIPAEMASFLDGDLVHQRRVMPVDKLGKLLTLAMVCPMDTQTIEDVEHVTGLKVKTMLCSWQDMAQALRSHVRIKPSQYPDVHTTQLAKELQTQIPNFDWVPRVLECESLPPHSALVQRLKAAQHETDRTPMDLVDIVANDPILTAMTLRVANSAAYALPNAVDTLDMAVALLGTEALIKVASDSAPVDYTQHPAHIDHTRWTLQTQFCGQAVKQIHAATGNPACMPAYSAALIHILGRFAMLHLYPNSYGTLTSSLYGTRLTQQEQSLYGTTHGELGYVLARKWNLPRHVAEAVRYQHDWKLASKARDVSAILAVAVLMTDSYLEDQPLTLDDAGDLLVQVGVSHGALGDLYRDTVEQFSGADLPQAQEPCSDTSPIT